MFFDRENRKQAREIEKQIVENQQLYQRVFDTDDGKRVLADLRKRCYMNATTYNDNHGRMSFSEGRRSIYIHIENLLEKDLKKILEDLTREP